MSEKKDSKQAASKDRKKRADELTNREAIEKLFPKRVINRAKSEVSK